MQDGNRVNDPLSLPIQTSNDSIPNVLVFGETGTGKSSLINMIAGNDVAKVSNDALGCTFGNVQYVVNEFIDGSPIRLWDTAGLNEGEHGMVSSEQAMQNLYNLVYNLKGGVNLLVYCIRATRFRDILLTNYELFSRIICQRMVPTVVVVTGLEYQDPMDSWWDENESEFSRRGMEFSGHACVTTTKGKRLKSGEYMFEEEYAESVDAVRKLVKTHVSTQPWIMGGTAWMRGITTDLAEYYRREQATSLPSPSMSAGTSMGRVSRSHRHILYDLLLWLRDLVVRLDR